MGDRAFSVVLALIVLAFVFLIFVVPRFFTYYPP